MKVLLVDVARELLQSVELPTYDDEDIRYLPAVVGGRSYPPVLLRHYDGGHFICGSEDSTADQKRAYCPGRWWHGYAGRLLICGVGRRRRLIDLTQAEILAYRQTIIFQTGPSSEWNRCRQRQSRTAPQLSLFFR